MSGGQRGGVSMKQSKNYEQFLAAHQHLDSLNATKKQVRTPNDQFSGQTRNKRSSVKRDVFGMPVDTFDSDSSDAEGAIFT